MFSCPLGHVIEKIIEDQEEFEKEHQFMQVSIGLGSILIKYRICIGIYKTKNDLSFHQAAVNRECHISAEISNFHQE